MDGDRSFSFSLVVTLSHAHLVLALPGLPFDQSVLPWSETLSRSF